MQKLSLRNSIRWSLLLLALLCSTILAACGATNTPVTATTTASAKPSTAAVAATTALAAAPSSANTGQAQAEVKIEKGGRAPNLVATDINGKPIQLSDFKGKAVLVNFFATW